MAAAAPPAPAPVTAPPAPAPVAAPAAPYKDPAAFSAEAFAAFLETAPYGRDVKPLLQLLATHAREPERRIALGLVLNLMPRIVQDSTLAGPAARAVNVPAGPDAQLPGKVQIALNDGPVIFRARKFLGARTIRLPDSPQFYQDRGLSQPKEAAFPRESASESEADEDGCRVRIYHDGSRRLRLPQEQLSGELLAALLDADSHLRGWKPDVHSRLRSESARFRFYRALAKDAGKEPALDRDMTASYREWLDRPEDFMDFILQTWGAAQDKALEISLLTAAGLMSPAEADKARLGIPKPVQPGVGVTELPVESPRAREAWLEIERLGRLDR